MIHLLLIVAATALATVPEFPTYSKYSYVAVAPIGDADLQPVAKIWFHEKMGKWQSDAATYLLDKVWKILIFIFQHNIGSKTRFVKKTSFPLMRVILMYYHNLRMRVILVFCRANRKSVTFGMLR